MGTILFYIFESTLCLTILYLLFRLFFRKDTLFRTNRYLLLMGTVACTLLPLLQIDVPQYTTLQLPITTVRHLLTEKEVNIERKGGVDEKHLSGEANLFMTGKGEDTEENHANVIHAIPVTLLLGGCYFIRALVVLTFLLFSTVRMRRLIHSYPACNYGKYKLIICPEKIVSFSWGNMIVLSQEDYERNPGEILLHEQMHLQHRHTLDLLWMECILIFHWFNPAAWLLMRELREVHEYEADNGVINNGIDATEYQLLLVKKAVGTRLYSMANGFNHSKLKNRITMMLKERTNGWARLKLLLFVPVMAGTLYAFARPEVKETFVQTVPGLHQKQAMDYQTLSKLLRNEEEAYNLRKFGKKVAPTTPENRMNQLLMNARNVMLFDGDYVLKENLKDKVKEKLLYKQRREKEKSGRKDEQIVGFWCDRGTNVDEARQALQAVYDAYTEIRDSIAIASGNDSKDFLDKEFPIVVSQYENLKKFGSQNGDCLSGIELNFMSGKDLLKELKNPTAEELQQAVTDYREKLKDGRKLSVRVKVDRECNMGTVLKMKQILRENW